MELVEKDSQWSGQFHMHNTVHACNTVEPPIADPPNSGFTPYSGC